MPRLAQSVGVLAGDAIGTREESSGTPLRGARLMTRIRRAVATGAISTKPGAEVECEEVRIFVGLGLAEEKRIFVGLGLAEVETG